MHDAAGADRAELGHRRQQFLAHHRLHAHIERQPQRRRILAQPLVEEFLHAGDAVAVHVDAAEHLRRDPTERIVPPLDRLELQPDDAEPVDRQFFLRRDLAFQVDELLRAFGEARADSSFVEPRQHGDQPVRRVGRVDDLAGVGVQARSRQRHRENFAVAVHHHRPGGVRAQVERGRQQLGPALAGRQRRRLGAPRCRDKLRLHGVDHGRIGELDRDCAEQHGEAGGRQHQPGARFFQRRAPREVGRGDAHVLHARHRGVARRAGAAGRRLRVGGRAHVLHQRLGLARRLRPRRVVGRAHRGVDCGYSVPATAGLTGVTDSIVRAMPSAEATTGTVGSTFSPRAMRAIASAVVAGGGT